MRYQKLGRTGLMVSELCLGTMTFGQQVDEAEAQNIIKSALEAGVNFIDTADQYVDGRTEEIVGRALKGERDSVVLATKVGAWRSGPGINDIGLSRKHIMKEVEASLRRLGTDYIDLYYAHRPDYNTPIDETLRALDDLVHQGKVRYIACSNFRAWQLCQALWVSDRHNLARFECIQTPYNLITRDIEYELLPLCSSQEVGVTVYNPLAGGLLTGKHDPNKPPAEGRFTVERLGPMYTERYWSAANFEAVAKLKEVASAHGRKLAQFALAWILNSKAITSIVLGVSSLKQLEENLQATEIALTEEELSACDKVWQELSPPRFLYGR
ncbi:MAG TPA: aldo/keto reductase [Dehalococcoidia bacterium]|nr:aldo/keto reductase [Dehalococcoidia bacterium]